MTKTSIRFVCQECDYETVKWMGKCPICHSWNTFTEKAFKNKKIEKEIDVKRAFSLSEIKSKDLHRLKTGVQEFDRVLGGGITRASLTLIGGNPGIGKSTLVMEVCGKVAKINKKNKVLYVSGEESEIQVANRAKRLNIKEDNFYILNETNWHSVLSNLKKIKPDFLVLDSIQTIFSSDIQLPAGSSGQVKEVILELMNFTKKNNLTCFVIGHVTKDGSLAGPKVLEHMVDTVLSFEGEKTSSYRFLRSIKNRFGGTDELGIFEMKEEGLFSLKRSLDAFRDITLKDSYGRSLTCVAKGNRSFLVEAQCLVVDNKLGSFKRIFQGVDHNRLNLLIAIIDKYFNEPLSHNDIFINVTNGIKLFNRESDLALLMSLLSSFYQRPISEDIVFVGELGLCGEVRPTAQIGNILKELEILKIKKVVTHKDLAEKYKEKSKIQLVGISKAQELKTLFFN